MSEESTLQTDGVKITAADSLLLETMTTRGAIALGAHVVIGMAGHMLPVGLGSMVVWLQRGGGCQAPKKGSTGA